jgi:hypothetical protein
MDANEQASLVMPDGKPTAGDSPERREKRRQATMRCKPWLKSTGPRTPEGKQRSAQNGRAFRRGEKPMRQIRAEIAPTLALARQMAGTRNDLERRFRLSPLKEVP